MSVYSRSSSGYCEGSGWPDEDFVDGGIRTGTDVFKALAMGADAALIARPFVTAAYGAGVQGVSAYTAKTGGELRDTMAMCGAFAVKEITEEMLW